MPIERRRPFFLKFPHIKAAPSFDAAERAAAEDATTTPDAAAAESAPQTGGEQSSAERKPTTEADVTPGGPESEPEEKR